jgi:hypothetical protein
MSEQSSELVAIARLNGDFKRHYGRLLGAFLYLRSVTATRGRSYFLSGLWLAALSVTGGWLHRQGVPWW